MFKVNIFVLITTLFGILSSGACLSKVVDTPSETPKLLKMPTKEDFKITPLSKEELVKYSIHTVANQNSTAAESQAPTSIVDGDHPDLNRELTSEQKFWVANEQLGVAKSNFDDISRYLFSTEAMKETPLVAKYKDALENQHFMEQMGVWFKKDPELLCPIDWNPRDSVYEEMRKKLDDIVVKRTTYDETQMFISFHKYGFSKDQFSQMKGYLSASEYPAAFAAAQKITKDTFEELKKFSQLTSTDTTQAANTMTKMAVGAYENALKEYKEAKEKFEADAKATNK